MTGDFLNIFSCLSLSGPLWEKHCKKDFPKATREEFESFREMYERCKVERADKLERLTAKMAGSYQKAKQDVRYNLNDVN